MKPVEGPFQPLDAQLMLLAAGELPEAEAQGLRDRLQADPELAARFDALSQEMSGLQARLASADRAVPFSQAAQRAAEREATRAVHAWLDRNTEVQPRKIAPSALETAVWHYARWPLAAAAAIVVGLILLPLLLDTTDDRGLRANRPPQEPRSDTIREGQPRAIVPFDDRFAGRSGGEMGRWETWLPGDDGARDSGEQLASLFDHPGQWDLDGERNLDLGLDLSDELATLQALGDAWSDDGY